MATTQKGIYYPDDYTAVADVPEDMKDLAESVDTALDTKVDKEEGKGLSTYNFGVVQKGRLDSLWQGKSTVDTDIARIKATFPTTTGSGENITLDKTAELEFIQPPLPRGNSEQKQYSGKNKFSGDFSQFNSTGGTGSAYGYFKLPDDSQPYTLSLIAKNNFTTTNSTFFGFTNNGGNGDGGTNWAIFGASQGVINKGTIISKTTTDYRYVSIYTNNAQTLQSFMDNFEIQLEQGSTATSYEPYVGGTASPNPSYPQAITNVTGDVEVVVQNKNIALNDNPENPDANYTSSGGGTQPVQYSSTEGGYYTTGNRERSFGMLKAGTYTVSLIAKTRSGTSSYAGLLRHSNGTLINTLPSKNSLTNNYQRFSVTFTLTNDEEVHWVVYETMFFKDIQLEQNTTASTYTPHQEQTLPLTLGDIELCKIGTAQDYFYKENNKWYLYKAINKVEITAENVDNLVVSKSVGHDTNRVYLYKTSLGWKNSWTAGVALINNYSEAKVTTEIESGKFSLNNGSTTLEIYDNRFTDLATARQLMIGTTIYIALATPTSTEITDTTLIEQLDSISQAISYEEQTNISGTSDESNPLFSVEAYQSIKLILAS